MNADGSIIAVADARDGAVTLVSTADGRTRGIVGETPVALDRDSYAAALAFDGRNRLLAGRLDDRVDVIDPTSATITTSIAVPASSAHVAMAVGPSGVVIASGDEHLIAFEPDGQPVRWSTDIGRPSPGQCNWLAISEPMQRVYCGSLFGRISVFDLADGAPLPDEGLGPLDGAVGTIDVTDGGLSLTTISGSHPVISRWRVDGGGLGHRLITPGRMVVGPYSYEGSSVLTSPQVALTAPQQILDGVAVVDTRSGEVTYRFDEPVSAVGWLRDRRLFARSADDEVFRIIDAETGEQVGKPSWDVYRFWPSPDGARLLAVMADGRIQSVDPHTGEPEGDTWRVEGWPMWISISPDGDRIAVTHWSDGTASDGLDGTASTQEGTGLAIVSADDHRVLYDEPIVVDGQVLLADGDLIGLEDNRIGRYETEPLARVGAVPGAAGDLENPSLSSDARTLLVMAAEGTALLYDAPTGARIGDPFHTDSRTNAPGRPPTRRARDGRCRCPTA